MASLFIGMNHFDIPGFREKINAAWKFQEETRIESVFAVSIQNELCGVPIVPLNLKHLLLLEAGNNGFVSGELKQSDALHLIWLLSESNKPGKPFNDFRRLLFTWKVYKWAKGKSKLNPDWVIYTAVSDFLTKQFLDLPTGNIKKEANPLDFPRVNVILSLVAQVMDAYPSFRHEELLEMNLPLLFQFLKLACQKQNPEYKGTQPTDKVIDWALIELNKLKGGV